MSEQQKLPLNQMLKEKQQLAKAIASCCSLQEIQDKTIQFFTKKYQDKLTKHLINIAIKYYIEPKCASKYDTYSFKNKLLKLTSSPEILYHCTLYILRHFNSKKFEKKNVRKTIEEFYADMNKFSNRTNIFREYNKIIDKILKEEKINISLDLYDYTENDFFSFLAYIYCQRKELETKIKRTLGALSYNIKSKITLTDSAKTNKQNYLKNYKNKIYQIFQKEENNYFLEKIPKIEFSELDPQKEDKKINNESSSSIDKELEVILKEIIAQSEEHNNNEEKNLTSQTTTEKENITEENNELAKDDIEDDIEEIETLNEYIIKKQFTTSALSKLISIYEEEYDTAYKYTHKYEYAILEDILQKNSIFFPIKESTKKGLKEQLDSLNKFKNDVLHYYELKYFEQNRYQKNKGIYCGRFDTALPELNRPNELIRLQEPLFKPLNAKSFLTLGVSEDEIYDGTTATPITQTNLKSLLEVSKKQKILVLTSKERELLVKYTSNNNVDIFSFESLCNLFKNRKPISKTLFRYNSEAKSNYQHLQNYLNSKIIQKYGLNISGYFVCENIKKVARKLKFKSSLDSVFYFYPVQGYQEVFKLFETRKDRCIIALDFNSMYGACLDGDFPDPSHLKYKKNSFLLGAVKKITSDFKQLEPGIYKVKLSYPKTEFIKKYHPFKYIENNNKHLFAMNNTDTIVTLLHKNEIIYYNKHFKEIKILDGVVSKQAIKHPLFKTCKELYKQRFALKAQLKAQQQKEQETAEVDTSTKATHTDLAEALLKLQISLLYSCVARKKTKDINIADIIETPMLSDITSLNPASFSKEDIYQNISSKINLKKDENGNYNTLNLHDYFNNENTCALYSQVIANGKIKMLETLEHILKFKNAELCYCNVDSIQVSIPKDKLEEFKQHMGDILEKESNTNLENLGKLKIEHIADGGYWLQPGRYWLFNDKQIIEQKHSLINYRFKNINCKSVSSCNIQRKFTDLPNYDDFKYLETKISTIMGTTTVNKNINIEKLTVKDKITHIDFERPDYKYVSSPYIRNKYKNIMQNNVLYFIEQAINQIKELEV